MNGRRSRMSKIIRDDHCREGRGMGECVTEQSRHDNIDDVARTLNYSPGKWPKSEQQWPL